MTCGFICTRRPNPALHSFTAVLPRSETRVASCVAVRAKTLPRATRFGS
jgi:hypothetical protein